MSIVASFLEQGDLFIQTIKNASVTKASDPSLSAVRCLSFELFHVLGLHKPDQLVLISD